MRSMPVLLLLLVAGCSSDRWDSIRVDTSSTPRISGEAYYHQCTTASCIVVFGSTPKSEVDGTIAVSTGETATLQFFIGNMSMSDVFLSRDVLQPYVADAEGDPVLRSFRGGEIPKVSAFPVRWTYVRLEGNCGSRAWGRDSHITVEVELIAPPRPWREGSVVFEVPLEGFSFQTGEWFS